VLRHTHEKRNNIKQGKMNDTKTLQELILDKNHRAVCLRLIGICVNETKFSDDQIYQIVKTAVKLLITESRGKNDKESLEFWLIVKHYLKDYYNDKDLFPE
jgi:hypothetical protein